jgi:hypothetical protein
MSNPLVHSSYACLEKTKNQYDRERWRKSRLVEYPGRGNRQAEVNPQVNLGVFQKFLDRWWLKKRKS